MPDLRTDHPNRKEPLPQNTIKLVRAVLHELRVPLGRWDANNLGDILDREVEKKPQTGYPQDTILLGERSHLYTNFIKQ